MGGELAILAVDSRCQLGECILWCERRQALLWADITGARLWMHWPGSGDVRRWQLPAALGCFALCEDGRVLLGLAKGLVLADPDAAEFDALALEHVADVEPTLAYTRINDGRCDRQGNFVFGTKCERGDGAPLGGWYQYSARHGLRRLALPGATIPNSICFDPDGRTMYYCDSRVPEIRCCDYDADQAAVSNLRTHARIEGAEASPDGSIIDAQGRLWNAHWGAARVVCYDERGSVADRVAIPAKNPSCCTFGGAALDRLYVTTAREDMSESELEATPHAGGVYGVFVPGARGLPEARVVLP